MNLLAALSVVIPLFLFNTPLSYILRSAIVYWSLLLASLLFPWIAFEIVQNDLGKYDVMWFVTTINSTIELILYKVFDRITLKTKDRHLYFYWRGRNYLSLSESWLDLIFQLLLTGIPILWFWIGQAIFE
jgi:hypothetical protein